MRFDLICTQKKPAPLSHIHSNNPPPLPQPTSADTHLHNKLGNHNFVIITSCKGTVFSIQIAGNLKVGFVFNKYVLQETEDQLSAHPCT
jgi:hypothetical protein